MNKKSRRLDGCNCWGQSCTCTDPHATSCQRDCSDCTKCYVKTCISGYYPPSTSTTCKLCPVIANCVQCQLTWGSTNPVCQTCVSGFAAINGVCVACPVGCTGCGMVWVWFFQQKISCTGCGPTLTLQSSNGVSTCGCLSNQFLSGGTCTTCPSACTTCTSLAVCTGCAAGYYLSASTCTSCMPVCKTCSTATTCATCLSNLFSLVGGVCTCNSPYFFDINTKSCLLCSALQSNCATCGYATAYSPSAPPAVVCVTANSGYYVNGNGTAAACIPYCSNCNSNPLLCDTPNTNFTFNGTNCVCAANLYFYNGSCIACASIIPGCTNCITNPIPTPTQCSTCDPNGYFNASLYPVTTCSACASLCLTCNSLTDCTLCVNNLLPGTGICSCTPYGTLYYDSATKSCLACNLVIFNCQACSSNGTSTVTCTSCGVGLFVSSTGLLCSSCPITCADCLNASYCSTCQAGYDMVNNTCVCGANCTFCMGNSTDGLCASCTFGPFTCSGCVAGNLLNPNGTCSPCNATFAACAECSAVACVACNSPFILMPSGCVCNNTASEYLSLDGTTCLPCGSAIANCLNCSTSASVTVCTLSADGFFLTNSSQTCAACAGYCLTCAGTAT
jgi:proprotein convertase subtilisin/kexin type 5